MAAETLLGNGDTETEAHTHTHTHTHTERDTHTQNGQGLCERRTSLFSAPATLYVVSLSCVRVCVCAVCALANGVGRERGPPHQMPELVILGGAGCVHVSTQEIEEASLSYSKSWCFLS